MHTPARTLAFSLSLAVPFGAATSLIAGEPAERELIEAVAEAVEQNYVYAEKGEGAADLLRQALGAGEYDGMEGDELASALRAALIGHTEDLHFGMRGMPEGWAPPSSAEQAQRRSAPQPPYGFNSVRRIDGNIGYIDLRAFNNARSIEETTEAAMRLVQGCAALIFDLRHNGGGNPHAVALITSYLYDPSEPVHLNSLYSRPDDRTTDYWTHNEINTDLAMHDVPIYILTSGRNFSAAEEFTYNLRNLGRATVVGETTGGGAHPVDFLLFHSDETDRYYQLVLPTSRAVSPITGTNWEGTGVKAHIECPSGQALDQALHHAYSGMLADGNSGGRFGMAKLNARLSPRSLSDSQRESYAGSYTDREFAVQDGRLMYRRVGNPGYRPLVCVDEDRFIVEGVDGFILHFERDDAGSIVAVSGLYARGHTDRSARTD